MPQYQCQEKKEEKILPGEGKKKITDNLKEDQDVCIMTGLARKHLKCYNSNSGILH